MGYEASQAGFEAGLRIAADAVEFDPAHLGGDDDADDQRDGQRDAAGERVHRALALALVDQHVVQAGTEVPENEDQDGDDQQGLHGNAPARAMRARGGIIAARARARVSRRRNLVVGWTLAVLATALFVRLGFWQAQRAVEKQAMLDAAAQVLATRQAQPLAIAAADARRARD